MAQELDACGGSAAVHILHAGDADAACFGKGGRRAGDDVGIRRRGDEMRHQPHRVVAQQAGRLLGLGIAIDDAAGRIGGFGGDAG